MEGYTHIMRYNYKITRLSNHKTYDNHGMDQFSMFVT